MPVDTCTIGLVGDLMLGRGISEATLTRTPSEFLGDVLPVLASTCAVIGNLESPITESEAEWRQSWKAFRYGADPCTVEILRAANIRAVSLANNHTLDRRSVGLADTLQHLKAAGIRHAGAGRNLEEALRPAIVDLGKLRIGLISITDTIPEFAAGPQRPGTNYLRIKNRGASLALIECLVRSARDKGADLVILSAHWGPNLRPWPPKRFRAFARSAIDLGVDIFHGHSAHLFQGIEARARGLILYDTGNFLDDYWTFPFIRTDRSFLFLVDLEDARPVRLRMLPVLVSNRTVQLARGREAAATLRSMIRRCHPFGSTPIVNDGMLVLDLVTRDAAKVAGGAQHRARQPCWMDRRSRAVPVRP